MLELISTTSLKPFGMKVLNFHVKENKVIPPSEALEWRMNF
jgi:hypothetical protein